MNVVPINNNNKNLSFEKIYRIKVSPDCFYKGKSPINIFDDFNKRYSATSNYINNQAIESLSKSKKFGFFKKIKTLLKIISESKPCSFMESLNFNNFQIMKATTGNADWWLASHLNIEEPKPISDKHHTFFVFTGEDKLKLMELRNFKNFYKIKNENSEIIEDKCIKNEYKDYDINYWTNILYSKKLDKMVKDTFPAEKIEDITINNNNEFYKIAEKSCERLSEILNV
jgi:hypothetical protein